VALSTWLGLYAVTNGIALVKLVLSQHYRRQLD
jgi:hypothetical protein